MKSIKRKLWLQIEDKAWGHLTDHNNPYGVDAHRRRYITARISDNLTMDFGDTVWISLVEEIKT
jgi:hypothetical protein